MPHERKQKREEHTHQDVYHLQSPRAPFPASLDKLGAYELHRLARRGVQQFDGKQQQQVQLTASCTRSILKEPFETQQVTGLLVC